MPDPNAPDDIEESLFKDAKHHRALAKVLEKVEKGHHPRLIVTLPPRHGKSELISRRFIPWLLGRDSYRNVIFATYNEDSATSALMSGPLCSNRHIADFPSFEFRKGGASKSRIQTNVVAWVCLWAVVGLSLAVVVILLFWMIPSKTR